RRVDSLARDRSSNRVDAREHLLRANLPGVLPLHRVREAQKLLSLVEPMKASFSFSFELLQNRRILARFELAAEGAGLATCAEDRGLQVGREPTEGLGAEAERAHGDGMLRLADLRADLVELHLPDARGLV